MPSENSAEYNERVKNSKRAEKVLIGQLKTAKGTEKRTYPLQKQTHYVLEKGKIGYGALRESAHELFVSNKKKEKLMKESMRDDMTGLYNRRGARMRLKEEMDAADRSGETLAIVFLDMDSLKEFNTKFGHQGGDRAIRGMAEKLKSFFRGYDLIARWGGDEFLIVMRNISQTSLEPVLNEFYDSLHVQSPEELEKGIPLNTASVGVAHYSTLESWKSLVHRADQAMKKSKKEGKDQIHFSLVDENTGNVSFQKFGINKNNE